MNEFKTYHPVINFTYFVFVIGFGCFFMNPVCLVISLFSGFAYSVMLKGIKAVRKNLIYMLPMIIIMALMNPLFNHQGITIINYFPNGNPLTLEAIIYGICTAFMIASVICHFSCYNEIMTSDKFIYLFGRIIPSMSLIISMTLRFVPRFCAQLKVTADTLKCMGRDVTKGSVIKRAGYGLNILSVMTSWALENSIETADSMKSRGYGLPGRTAFSVFIFDKRDRNALIFIMASAIYTLIGYLAGSMYFNFFPYIKWADMSIYGVSVFISHALFCMCPIIIEIREVRRWKVSERRI